jgi:hypothetical protein
MARSKRIITGGSIASKLQKRLGATFGVGKVTVRGVPGDSHARIYTAYLAAYIEPNHNPIFVVRAEGRTCPYDVLVIKARLLAELTPRGD